MKCAFGSVSQLLKAGNRVHLEKDNCNAQHIATKKKIPVKWVKDSFEIGMWVPRADKSSPGFTGQVCTK